MTKNLITELSCMQKYNISPWHPSRCSCDDLQLSTASTSSTALIDVVFLAAISASTIGCFHTPQPDDVDLVRHVHAPCFLWLFVWIIDNRKFSTTNCREASIRWVRYSSSDPRIDSPPIREQAWVAGLNIC